jgi:predicted O-methyltransferase YrrM
MTGHFKLGMHDHPDLQNYLRDHTTPEDPLLAELFRETYVKVHHPRRSSDHLIGQWLAMVVRMMKPARILEIGTFTGYGTLAMAAALPDNGIIHTIEINDELENHLKDWIGRSPHGHKIRLHIGDALEIIPKMDETFDLVFIDGEKDQYNAYYDLVFDKIKPGGILLADNALWSGKVLDGDIPENDRFTLGVMEFNDRIQADPRVENVLLPVFDGMMVVYFISSKTR